MNAIIDDSLSQQRLTTTFLASFVGAALIARLVPARRSALIDPIQALRIE